MLMNTYLKVTVLVLGSVCLMLGALAYKSEKALVAFRPMVIRINEVGRAEAIDYRNFSYRPQEAENKYYLAQWATLFFERNRYSIERDQRAALFFLNGDVQRSVVRQEQEEKTIGSFESNSSKPYVDIDIRSVLLDDLKQSPYGARIEFEKVYTNPADHTVVKRERWIASVTYVFANTVANEALSVNPLGLTIVRYRADQAFD
jgi:type IV secretion system protein VirB5